MRLEEANHSYKQNLALAFRLGMNIPRIVYFEKAAEEDMNMVNSDPYGWRIIDNRLAVEKKKGMRVTYTTYYSGEEFTFFTASFHRRNILSGGLGSALDENLLTVFHIDKCPIIKKLESMIEVQPDYKGIIQVEVLVDSNNKIWYEVIRMGANLEYLICLNALHSTGGTYPIEDIRFKKGFAVGCLVYYFPNLECNTDYDFIYETNVGGYAVNSGEQILPAWKELYRKLKDLKDINLCYRNDGGDKERRSWHTLRKKSLDL
jgi:hypothetical protein